MELQLLRPCISQQLAAMLQREVDMQQQQQQSFERLKDSLGLHNLSEWVLVFQFFRIIVCRNFIILETVVAVLWMFFSLK